MLIGSLEKKEENGVYIQDYAKVRGSHDDKINRW